jgi:hypothetical protein
MSDLRLLHTIAMPIVKGDSLHTMPYDSRGRLTIDDRFRDPGASRPGVSVSERAWPHAFVGHAMAHGAVFGPAQAAKGNGSVH